MSGALYFFLVGLSRLFNDGRPYLKFMKHVDLDLPIVWLFQIAEALGLYHRIYVGGYDPSPTLELQGVALGTLLYMAMGYVLGIIIEKKRPRQHVALK
jgi:hypothetical protein